MTTAAEAVSRWLRGESIATIALDCEGGPDAIEDVIRADMQRRAAGLQGAIEAIDTIAKMWTEAYEKATASELEDVPCCTKAYRKGLGQGAYYAAQGASHAYNFVLGFNREREPGKVEGR